MSDIRWQEPWYSIEGDTELQDGLDAELRKEMAPGHVLATRAARAVGRRCDNDDVLYVLDANGPAYAVVHLSWRLGREKHPVWPATRLFVDAHDVMANCIAVDAADYADFKG